MMTPATGYRHRDGLDPQRLVEAAVRYAEHGWPVLPLHTPHPDRGCSCPAVHCGSPGKHPRTPRGLHDATTDPDRVRGWWGRWPDANIAVTTGPTSGLLVLDLDLPDGPDSLAQLEADHGRLPATCSQRTGSGGRQLLFAYPDSPVGNRAGLEPGLDIRGEGGYVVVPPSLHASGRRYRWIHSTPVVDPPTWLLERLDRTRAQAPTRFPSLPPLPTGTTQQWYAAAALRDELARLAVASEGTRNHTLNRAAFNLGQLVGTGLLDADRVAGELERVGEQIGLGSTEIRRTIASGVTAGRDHPRTPQVNRRSQTASTPPPVRAIGARRR